VNYIELVKDMVPFCGDSDEHSDSITTENSSFC
jgi:hypothetical protein